MAKIITSTALKFQLNLSNVNGMFQCPISSKSKYCSSYIRILQYIVNINILIRIIGFDFSERFFETDDKIFKILKEIDIQVCYILSTACECHFCLITGNLISFLDLNIPLQTGFEGVYRNHFVRLSVSLSIHTSVQSISF